MILMPIPCVRYNFFKAIVYRIPAKNFSCLFTGSHQSCRISSTLWRFNCRNRVPCHFSCFINYFFYGIADTISKIENIAFVSVFLVLYSENMCLSQIGNMDVVSDTSSIRRIIICSIDGDTFSLSIGDLKNQRNQMTFRIMSLADFT